MKWLVALAILMAVWSVEEADARSRRNTSAMCVMPDEIPRGGLHCPDLRHFHARGR